MKRSTPVSSENMTNNQPYLGNGARYEVSYSRISAFDWYKIGDLE